MADNIVQMDFTNVGVSFFGLLPAPVTGSLDVNYTASTVTGTLSGTIFGVPATISSWTLVPLGPGSYSIESEPYLLETPENGLLNVQFIFSYSSETPSQLTEAHLSSSVVDIGLVVSPNALNSSPVCYAAGTLIRTPRGDVPIETLSAGDVVVTASGEYRPVKWVGHRVIDCRNHSAPRAAWPIRIAADAIGPNQPSQDLLVSPAHTICVDLFGETLVHAAHLVNGASIVQVEVDEIDYWHVELESHDLLVANNLAAESYMEMANRAFFVEGGATLSAYAAGAGRTYDDFCRPVMQDSADLAFVRRRLIARAEAIGWTRSRDTDLRLVVDGETIRPAVSGDAAVFRLPAHAKDVRLVSNTFVPADVGVSDGRRLGVSLLGLAFVGQGETREIALDDPRLADGFHPQEAEAGAHWRWTTGELRLSPELFAGLAGDVALHVRHNDSATRAWVAPSRAETRPALRLVKAG